MSNPPSRLTPRQMFDIIETINHSMFGKKWSELVEQSKANLKQLVDITLKSQRDEYIFTVALHLGIKYGVAYSHALQNAQKPLNILKSLYRRWTKRV